MTRIDSKRVAQPRLKLEQAAAALRPALVEKKRALDEMSTGAGKALRLKSLSRPGPFHDVLVATKLKGAINGVLATVRLGKPIAEKDEPRPGPNGRYVAPNGDPLIRVKLNGSNGIPGSSEYALVNPKTNEFYKEDNVGGFTHPTNYYGPMSLPRGTRFEGKKYSEAELKMLERVANKGPLIRKDPLAALEAHLKAGDLDFSHKAPNPKDILKSTVIKSEHPFTYTAIVLKSDPNHVIIKKVLTGGFVPAGPNDGSYSQPIEVG